MSLSQIRKQNRETVHAFMLANVGKDWKTKKLSVSEIYELHTKFVNDTCKPSANPSIKDRRITGVLTKALCIASYDAYCEFSVNSHQYPALVGLPYKHIGQED